VQQSLARVTFVVTDYDEAILFFTQRLGFALIEDTQLEGDKRWVVVAPQGGSGTQLVLARAADDRQRSAVGNQTGGRVAFFLRTDDFWRDYRRMSAAGVVFVRPPQARDYGTVAVFEDLYGNLWDLLGPATPAPRSAG
jgi:catechol 2,3-dioxygenase-like lactoylglutathione lyase family enzyme